MVVCLRKQCFSVFEFLTVFRGFGTSPNEMVTYFPRKI